MTKLFPLPLRETARDHVRKALRAAFPDNERADPQTLEEYGDSLFLIAETFEIPVECLIWWIHDQPAGKDFSLRAWRLWCAKYDVDRNELPPAAEEALPEPPQARETPLKKAGALCTRCYAAMVQQIEGSWWCPKCGRTQLARPESGVVR